MNKYGLLQRMSFRGTDDLDTPPAALQFLLPYLPLRIWECAPGRGALVKLLQNEGKIVIASNTTDFLEDTLSPLAYDAIVTNPPFSKKSQFLGRCTELGKPWALLLPVTTLGVRACQKYLYDAEIIFLPKRIDFTGKKAPWFAVAWFTHGLGIGRQMVFIK